MISLIKAVRAEIKLRMRMDKMKEKKATLNEWMGQFGDDYTKRNLGTFKGRQVFWASLLKRFDVENVLEVGCNIGLNLQCIPAEHVYGIDVNKFALNQCRKSNALWGDAVNIPFKDKFFDLVFTMGVLIHLSEDMLVKAMDEICRCSRKYVLAIEYYSAETVEVPYRGYTIFKRDYGALYKRFNLDLVETDKWSMGGDAGSYWMFRKTR